MDDRCRETTPKASGQGNNRENRRPFFARTTTKRFNYGAHQSFVEVSFAPELGGWEKMPRGSNRRTTDERRDLIYYTATRAPQANVSALQDERYSEHILTTGPRGVAGRGPQEYWYLLTYKPTLSIGAMYKTTRGTYIRKMDTNQPTCR